LLKDPWIKHKSHGACNNKRGKKHAGEGGVLSGVLELIYTFSLECPWLKRILGAATTTKEDKGDFHVGD
jgi:hypothetical protein